MSLPPSFFGIPHLRSEDPRFLRGEGRYLENIPVEGALRAVFVRSIMAHSRVDGLDSGAAAMPGVAAIFIADDLALAPQPPSGNVHGPMHREILGRDVVRFVGEPLAVVVAATLAQAMDAAARPWWPTTDPFDVVTEEAAVAEARRCSSRER